MTVAQQELERQQRIATQVSERFRSLRARTAPEVRVTTEKRDGYLVTSLVFVEPRGREVAKVWWRKLRKSTPR